MNKFSTFSFMFLYLLLCTGSVSQTIAIGDGKNWVVAANGTVFVWPIHNLTADSFDEIPNITDIKSIAAMNGQRNLSVLIDENGTIFERIFRNQQLEFNKKAFLPPIKAASSARHLSYSIAIDMEGNLWKWWINKEQHPCTIFRDRYWPIHEEQEASLIDSAEFTALAEGCNHFIALSGNGSLWTWGEGTNGQLGHGCYTHEQRVPALVNSQEHFIAIAAGNYHSLALDDKGRIWAWGNGGDGKLGNGTTDPQLLPTLVNSEEYFVAIAAGYYHSLAIDRDGNVWSWGVGENGQLGHGDDVQNKTIPTKVERFTQEPIVAMAAAEHHSLFLDKGGKVWECGNGLLFERIKDVWPEVFKNKNNIRRIEIPHAIKLPSTPTRVKGALK